MKSALRLGVGLAECDDPTSEIGLVNVRYADRTYASVRDLKIFATAISTSQAALADACSTSITNLEQAFELLEENSNTFQEATTQALDSTQQAVTDLSTSQRALSAEVRTLGQGVSSVDSRLTVIEQSRNGLTQVTSLDTTANDSYYSGQIEIVSGVVTGSGTQFQDELRVGAVFTAETADGEEVEFTVASFNTLTPQTGLTVTPTDRNIAAGSRFRKSQLRETRLKVNELLSVLRTLQIIP